MNPSLRNRDLPSILGMLLFVAVFLGVLEIASPLFFLNDDNCTYFLPAYLHNYRTLRETGELAHVNFFQFMGTPHLASQQPATLYPPVYAAVWTAQHILGDVRATIDLLVVSHLLLCSLAMYWLARHLKFVPLHAALLGIVWATMPFGIVVARAWLFVTYLAVYLPLNFLFLLRLLEAPRCWSRAVPLVVVKTVFILTGYLQFFVLGSLFEGVFLLGRWCLPPQDRSEQPAWWRELVAVTAVAVLTLGLAAPQLLPAIQAKDLSKYRASRLSYEVILGNSMSWPGFVRAQFLRPEAKSIFKTSGAIFFVGLPTIAGALWILAQGPKNATRIAWICAATGVAALVLTTPLYRLVCFSSLLASFRWPFKGFLFAAFYLTLAAGFAWDRWRASRDRWRDWSSLGLALTIACHMFLFAWPENRRPFSSYQLPFKVPALREATAYQVTSGLERAATFSRRPTHESAFLGASTCHWTMGFNYATIAGAYQLGGYDPIVPWRQADLARGVNHSAQISEPITAELIRYLGECSVRWLLVPFDSPNAKTLSLQDGVQQVANDDRVTIFRMAQCAPLAQWQNGKESIPVETTIRANELSFATRGKGGDLRVNFAFHPAYRFSADGKDLGAVRETTDHRMHCQVPPGTQVITIQFVDRRFLGGLILAAATTLVLLGIGLWTSGPAPARS